jgi:hypothetical protein
VGKVGAALPPAFRDTPAKLRANTTRNACLVAVRFICCYVESTTNNSPGGGGGSNPTTTARPSTQTTSSAKPANTGGSSSGGNGKSYSASFTQYGSTDSWGSGNCQTKSTACGFYTQGYNAAVSQNVFGVGPVRNRPTSTS